jgi:hypothetical protein
MPTATESDVKGVIDTDLSTSEINNYLEDAEFDAEQEIKDYANKLTSTEKTQLEKYLAALYIVTMKDRRAEKSSVGDSSITYEASTVRAIKSKVQKRDPSNTLASNLINDDRHISTTGD